MKLYSIAQWNSGKFAAGVITGKIIFKSESLMLQDIIFSPYFDISQKDQIKDIDDYLTIDKWFTIRFNDIFGPKWPSSRLHNLKQAEAARAARAGYKELPYYIDDVSWFIKFEINANKIWVCSSTSQLGVWYDRRFSSS